MGMRVGTREARGTSVGLWIINSGSEFKCDEDLIVQGSCPAIQIHKPEGLGS